MAGVAPVGLAATATEVLDVVERVLHAKQQEWLFLRELRVGTGRHRNHALQRLDAFALNCLPHLGLKRVCYEVKTSRADFLCELKHPLKRRIGMRYSNEFYFAVPAGLLLLNEIPAECGLIEVGAAALEESRSLVQRQAGMFGFDAVSRRCCAVTAAAPWRDTPGPTWELVAAMLRNQRRGLVEKLSPEPAQGRLTFES